MKRTVPIEKTFSVIRALPPEMDFAGIQQFVMLHPVIPVNPHFNWITFKNFLPMIAITSVVTVALLLSRPAHQASSPVSQSNNETIPQLIEAPLPMLPDSPEKEAVKVVPPVKKKSVSAVSSSASNSTVSATSQATTVSATASANEDSGAMTVIVNTCGDAALSTERVRTTPSANCKCTFGSDDDWIDDVVKELLKEKLIVSECEYKFKLTAQAFYVNGKNIDDSKLAAKMMDLYAASTGERLRNDEDYIAVKVTEDCCSLSKNINN